MITKLLLQSDGVKATRTAIMQNDDFFIFSRVVNFRGSRGAALNTSWNIQSRAKPMFEAIIEANER